MADDSGAARFVAAVLRSVALRLVAVALLFQAGIAPLAAQLPIAQVPGTPSPEPAAAQTGDPLGRETPFGTVTGFSAAVHRKELVVASRYLQSTGRRPEDLENVIRALSDLLDRYFTGMLTSVSRAPAGTLSDGLDARRERIPLSFGDQTVDLFLTRIEDPAAGRIWLFSSESLARVPSLQRSAEATWVERVMPAALNDHAYFGLSLAQWILYAASIAGPLLLFWALSLAIGAIGRRRISDPTQRALFESWWNGVRRLIVVGLALAAHMMMVRLIGFSLTFRYFYARAGLVVAIFIGALLVWRLVAVTFHHARLLAMRRGRSSTGSLIMFSERVVKVFVVLVAIFALLAVAGVDPTTALAGVGLAGIAVALGAQKSVENLLGGVFLLTDQVLAIGDYCRLSDREGWVEDVTLRSVRLRTLEQTLLSVPAGTLSQGSIENISKRGKILAQNVLRLRYGTTNEQLQAVLDQTRLLLATHPQVEKPSARFRLTAFGAQAIELELFAYITTSEFPTFLEVREHLLLQIAHIVTASGTAFADPQTLDLRDRDPRPRVAEVGGRAAN